MKIPVGILWNAVKSGFLGFFLAGAVVFPLVEPFYIVRVIFSLGLIAIAYGIESVITFGHVTTSGLLSEGSTDHDVRNYAIILWLLLFAYYTYRDWRLEADGWQILARRLEIAQGPNAGQVNGN